jgi:hypothetical protein
MCNSINGRPGDRRHIVLLAPGPPQKVRSRTEKVAIGLSNPIFAPGIGSENGRSLVNTIGLSLFSLSAYKNHMYFSVGRHLSINIVENVAVGPSIQRIGLPSRSIFLHIIHVLHPIPGSANASSAGSQSRSQRPS